MSFVFVRGPFANRNIRYSPSSSIHACFTLWWKFQAILSVVVTGGPQLKTTYVVQVFESDKISCMTLGAVVQMLRPRDASMAA